MAHEQLAEKRYRMMLGLRVLNHVEVVLVDSQWAECGQGENHRFEKAEVVPRALAGLMRGADWRWHIAEGVLRQLPE